MGQRKKTFYFSFLFYPKPQKKGLWAFTVIRTYWHSKEFWCQTAISPWNINYTWRYQISFSIIFPDLCHVRWKQTYSLTCAKYHLVQKYIFSRNRKWSYKLFFLLAHNWNSEVREMAAVYRYYEEHSRGSEVEKKTNPKNQLLWEKVLISGTFFNHKHNFRTSQLKKLPGLCFYYLCD